MKIVNVVGARPNFMKIAPIQKEMANYKDIKPFLVHTGQHYDERMSKLFFEDLKLPEPDVYLDVGSASHAVQTAQIMIEFEKILLKEKPDLVVVVGDVNSTAACSIVASKLHIKVAHVEAGLRSMDRRMPEEINRLITDSISDMLFVTEPSGLKNLKNEGIPDSKIHYVGNVMIDSLIHHKEMADKSNILNDLKISKSDYALITMHRPSNVDYKETLTNLISTFEKIEKNIKLIFPIHPRSRKMIQNFGLDLRVKKMQNLKLLDPLGYLDFMKLLHNCKFVLTDSGGLQEETTFLQIPCITMRENTERPVTIDEGTNVLVGTNMHMILNQCKNILSGNPKKGKIPKYWDGNAARRTVKIMHEELS